MIIKSRATLVHLHGLGIGRDFLIWIGDHVLSIPLLLPYLRELRNYLNLPILPTQLSHSTGLHVALKVASKTLANCLNNIGALNTVDAKVCLNISYIGRIHSDGRSFGINTSQRISFSQCSADSRVREYQGARFSAFHGVRLHILLLLCVQSARISGPFLTSLQH